MIDWYMATRFAFPFMLAVSYTATEVVQILAAIGVLVGIIGGIVVNIVSTWRVEKKADDRAVVLADVVKKAAVIEGHVNSEATSLKSTIDSLQRENAMLKATASDNREIAARLAQVEALTRASTMSIPVAMPSSAPVAPAAHLQEIEQNTKDTATNTARTEERVEQAIKEGTK